MTDKPARDCLVDDFHKHIKPNKHIHTKSYQALKHVYFIRYVRIDLNETVVRDIYWRINL